MSLEKNIFNKKKCFVNFVFSVKHFYCLEIKKKYLKKNIVFNGILLFNNVTFNFKKRKFCYWNANFYEKCFDHKNQNIIQRNFSEKIPIFLFVCKITCFRIFFQRNVFFFYKLIFWQKISKLFFVVVMCDFLVKLSFDVIGKNIFNYFFCKKTFSVKCDFLIYFFGSSVIFLGKF